MTRTRLRSRTRVVTCGSALGLSLGGGAGHGRDPGLRNGHYIAVIIKFIRHAAVGAGFALGRAALSGICHVRVSSLK